MSYDPTDCELGICGPCETCVEQMQIDDMPPAPEPTTKLADDDFKSLLETEPPAEAFSPTREGWVERVGAEMCRAEKAEHALALAQKTATAAVERIKSLEGVLVAVRAGLTTIKNYSPGEWNDETRRRNAALDHVLGLIGETLDPHKPWCADERHEGACVGKDDGYEGERDE